MYYQDANISELVGKVFVDVRQVRGDELHFTEADGTVYVFYHSQDCCEDVCVESVVGDLHDLENTPIILAEESTSRENPSDTTIPEYQDSFTWTFYKFATIKGYVDIRWYGQSNGFYSESVDLRKDVCS